MKSAGRLLANGRVERVGMALAGLGTVQSKAGIRAAIAGLRETQSVGEISKLTRLATARGRGTLAILKTLGRDSFVLGAVAFTAYGWLVGLFINLFLIVVAIQNGFVSVVRRFWPPHAWSATQVAAVR